MRGDGPHEVSTAAGHDVAHEAVHLEVAQQLDHRYVGTGLIRPPKRRMRGLGEERGDPRSVVLDPHRFVKRKRRSRKHLQIGIITLVVLGDRPAEPTQISAGRRLVRLLFRQRRVDGGLFGQPAHDEVELNVGGFLTPQRAVVVEHRDAVFGCDVIRTLDCNPPHEVDDGRLRGTVGPRGEFGHVQPPRVARNFSSSSTAWLIVNDAGSCRGGNSLKVSRNWVTIAEP